MEGGECSEEVKLYLFAAKLEENPPAVFYLANPQEKVEPGDASIFCQSLFESDMVSSLEPKNVVLKFVKTSNLTESVELELTAGQDQNPHNLELVINPSKETAILTTYDTHDGSMLWRSANIYSMVPVLASINSASKQFMATCDDDEPLPIEIGGTNLRYRGNISKVSFYPLSIDFTRDFIVTGLLGEGASGTVYKCTRGCLQFAIKKTCQVSRNSPSTEVDSMIRLSGTKHVVQIYAAWYESSEFGHTYIAMELFERTLENYLAERNETNMEKSTKMFTEIMSGVHAIHQEGIIHRDIKPMNILVDSNEHISITDFGMAAIKPHPTSRYAGHEMYGTRYYCDPVLNLEHVQHDEKVDLFSCGMIYFEMHLPKVTQRMSMLRKFCDKWKHSKKDKKYNFWNSSLWTNWGGSKDIMKDLVTPLYRPDSSYFLDKLQAISQREEDKQLLE